MGLGKTFTNSIVREIGRNYGKAISNSLMGNAHSTPVRGIDGSGASSRRKYESKLDELLTKFEIKGKVATLNQGQNIHHEFFSLVEYFNKDGSIDVDEFHHLARYIPRVTSTLNRIIVALNELKDPESAELVSSKLNDIKDFNSSLVNSIESSMTATNWENPIKSKVKNGILLSLIGVDRILFYPKQIKSYIPVIFQLYLYYMSFFEEGHKFELGLAEIIAVQLTFIFIYSAVWNPLFKGGVWRFRKENKQMRKAIDNIQSTINQLKSI